MVSGAGAAAGAYIILTNNEQIVHHTIQDNVTCTIGILVFLLILVISIYNHEKQIEEILKKEDK